MTIAEQLDFDFVTARRDRVLRETEKNGSDWEIALIDQAVLGLAALRPVSANDFRDLLPEITNRHLIGARIRSLLARKRLVKVGRVVSTDPGTHAKEIGVYVVPVPCWTCNRQAPEVEVSVCCSSHDKPQCHGCYRRFHFVEVCGTACRRCRVEGLPAVISS